MSNRHVKLSNKGVSLVELIVIIAILSVVSAATVSLMGLIPRRQVVECTKKLVSALEKTRTNAMSFQDAKLYLCDTEQGIYVMLETTKKEESGGTLVPSTNLSNPELIGDKGLDISYEVRTGGSDVSYDLTQTTYATLSTDNCLAFSFDRSAGSFKNVYLGTEDKGVPTKILIKRGRWVMQIDLVQLTGKVTYDWKVTE